MKTTAIMLAHLSEKTKPTNEYRIANYHLPSREKVIHEVEPS